MDLFREGQQRVARILQSALSSIHIPCDAWASSNYLATWGIMEHFTSEEGKLECPFLSLTEINGSHTGENQVNIFLGTLTSYNIRN